ncbi:MAG: hypothetical protein ABI528_09870 [bacterium]
MNKKAIFFLHFALALILSIQLNAQSFKWVNHQSHNIPFNPDFAQFPSATDQSGNSFIAVINNYKLNFGQGYYGDFAIKKFNPSGVVVLNKILYGKLIIKDMTTDHQGGIYLLGSFMDTLKIDSVNYIYNTGSGFDVNYFLIKLSSAGDLIWKKNINSIYSEDYNIESFRIRGNSLYAGMSDIFTSYLKKFDLNGNELMTIVQTHTRGISSIDSDENGNIYAGGPCTNGTIIFNGHKASTEFGYNIYFVKYNSAGVCQWVRFVQDMTFQRVDIECDHQGNLIASGDLFGNAMFGTIQSQGPQWVYDFFITKIDASGNFLWLKEVPQTATITGDAGKADINSISVDLQNNIYFCGFLRMSIDWGNNIITTAPGFSPDVLLLKLNSNGNIIYGKTAGGNSSDRADCISLDNAGNVFISGNFGTAASFDKVFVSGSGNLNSFLAKMSSGLTSGSVNLSVIMQGFYDQASDKMRMNDTVRMSLRNSASPYANVDSSVSVIDMNTFNGAFNISNAPSASYYVQIRHRNSIETWSSSAVSYTQGGITNYTFVNAASNAFGNNLKQLNSSPVRFGIYSGDVNQDGTIDVSDLLNVYNDQASFLSGYLPTDLNGDDFTDVSDLLIVYNNSANFVGVIKP